LIQFNINADAGTIENFFTGVPTPLGAILLWIMYLCDSYNIIPSFLAIVLMVVIAWSLNSKVKIPHP